MATAELEASSLEAEVMEQPLKLHRFSVADYYRMAEVGILKSSERVELLDGVICNMSPIGPAHASVVDRLNRILNRNLPDADAIIRIQNPTTLNESSEPQPDLIVAKYRQDYYAKAHPEPDDLLLVIEVADATLIKDLKIKLPLYAEAGVQELWVVDINGQAILQFRNPTEKTYAVKNQFKPGETVEIILPGGAKTIVPVNDILGLS